jgi:hypothetical protein
MTGRIVEEAEREWPIWSLSSKEQSSADWLADHDEDGHDYADDISEDCD